MKKSSLLPLGISVVNLFWIFPAILKSDFWGDDFINLTYYQNTFTPLEPSAGKLTINFFWGALSYIFGSYSSIPYLLLNSLVALVGVYSFMTIYNKQYPESHLNPFWLITLLLSSCILIPVMLHTSNIVHSISILALGIALNINADNGMRERKPVLSILSEGFFWTLLIVSNLLYVACLIFPLLTVVKKVKNSGSLKRINQKEALYIIVCILLPASYFLFVAYPLTTSKQAYSNTSSGNIPDNIEFYLTFLTNGFLTIPIIITILGIMLFVVGVVNLLNRDGFAFISLLVAIGIIIPILMQGQQRGIHYFSIPLCLVFIALGGVVVNFKKIKTNWSYTGYSALILMTLFLLIQSQYIRAWFIESPYGSPLTSLRYDISQQVGKTNSLCISSQLSNDEWIRFTGGIAYERGFAVSPIHNRFTTLSETGECGQSSDFHFQISKRPNGEYFAVLVGSDKSK
jgi:hypothetical protein